MLHLRTGTYREAKANTGKNTPRQCLKLTSSSVVGLYLDRQNITIITIVAVEKNDCRLGNTHRQGLKSSMAWERVTPEKMNDAQVVL